MTLAEAVAAFVQYLKTERRSPPGTVEAYQRELVRLCAFALVRGSAAVDDVGRVDVEFLRAWLHAVPCSAASTARKVTTLRSWMLWLRRREFIRGTSPADQLETPKVVRGLPMVISVESASQLMSEPSGETPAGKRDRAILELLYGSGLRASELCALDLGAIRLADRIVRVLGKGNKEREVPMGRPCVAALAAWLAVRGTFPIAAAEAALFVGALGGRLGRRVLQRIVATYGAQIGLRGLHPHALRHTCATHMLDGGADLRAIQEMLGHARLTTTQRYTDVSMAHVLRVYAAAHPLARLPRRKPRGRRGE